MPRLKAKYLLKMLILGPSHCLAFCLVDFGNPWPFPEQPLAEIYDVPYHRWNALSAHLTSISLLGAFQKIMWKLNKSIAKELLPIEPVEFLIEPWWGVCLVNFTLEEFKVSCHVIKICSKCLFVKLKPKWHSSFHHHLSSISSAEIVRRRNGNHW